jgi:DNA N-6-adenine-methyltransferase (Dam)
MSEVKTGFTHESQAAKSIEWYTPPSIFEGLKTQFSMDVCAPEGGLPWIPALHFLSKKDNGLTTPWYGTVWCNPSYGKETPLWLAKLKEHGNGLALVFSRTDCKWFFDYVVKSDAILFLKGRVKFVDGNGDSGNSGAGNGSMLVAYGEEGKQILEKCNLQGAIYYPDKKG